MSRDGGGPSPEGGARVVGRIEEIRLHEVPSLFAGGRGAPVTWLRLAVESAVGPDGRAIDPTNFIGLHFQAPAALVDAFSVGERVELVTTTPTGMHVARIVRAPLH